MKSFIAATCTVVLLVAKAEAQSFCASDGQPAPVQLMERFVNADCDSCWSAAATPRPGSRAVALDWIIPGKRGEEGPLSGVATRDALARLEALKKTIPTQSITVLHRVKGLRGATLRVAHGLPLADYVGASIELKPLPKTAKDQRWTSWLALVETLPAGTERSPVVRNLVRNLLQTNWDGRKQLSKDEQHRFFETRSMNIATAANPNRLRVIGWVEDENGQVVAAAQSRCIVP